MGISEIAVERIIKSLIEEKTIVKLLKMLESEDPCDREIIFSSKNRKTLTRPRTIVEHTLQWFN
ncbi:MAG TPA: hypothetical protein VE619_04715 [Nitrososphaeraceae archaeon]|nr:hypothetical protein [Nitrososphaeraceae archaeon]